MIFEPRLARVEDIPDGGAIVIGSPIALLLARRGELVFAYENICPHAGAGFARADGGVLVQEGRYIVCPAHGASFTLDTGACSGGPCNGQGLTAVVLEVRDGAVFTPPSRPDRRSDRADGAS